LYSIKDLAIESGVSYHTVYHYLRRNLIKEVGIIGEDQRVFDEACLEHLRKVLALREAGKSIAEIEKMFAEKE
jgi:DNA-binding transcriptional MerR regulator